MKKTIYVPGWAARGGEHRWLCGEQRHVPDGCVQWVPGQPVVHLRDLRGPADLTTDQHVRRDFLIRVADTDQFKKKHGP